MLQAKDRAWAEISLDCIAANYRAMKKYIRPDCQIIAVLKADGYGHGAVAVGQLLERLGCDIFAVASLEEGLELREHGISVPIMLLSPVMQDYLGMAAENRMIVPLVSVAGAKELSDYAQHLNKEFHAFIKVDCGLSRFGLVVPGREKEAVEEVCEIASLPNLKIHSIMTHLTAGGVAEQHALNLEQLECFRLFTESLKEKGIALPIHCCASRLAVRYPDYQFDYVRIGSDLYGVHPYYGEGPHFQPAMELKARILQVKEIPKGTAVGYGPAFHAERKTKVAVLPIGYVDGLSCRLGNGMQMLVHGKRVAQIGRLFMDYCMLDVTDVPDVQQGDIVTVFGADKGEFLSVQEHAALYPGTASELICLLGRRISRFYRGGISDGESGTIGING